MCKIGKLRERVATATTSPSEDQGDNVSSILTTCTKQPVVITGNIPDLGSGVVGSNPTGLT